MPFTHYSVGAKRSRSPSTRSGPSIVELEESAEVALEESPRPMVFAAECQHSFATATAFFMILVVILLYFPVFQTQERHDCS